MTISFNAYNGVNWQLYPTGTALDYTEASDNTLLSDRCYGSIVNNYGQTGNVTITLPTPTVGMNFLFIASTTVGMYYRFDPGVTDSIYIDGITTGDGKYVGTASIALGDCIQFIAIKTGVATYDWLAVVSMGSWTAEV